MSGKRGFDVGDGLDDIREGGYDDEKHCRNEFINAPWSVHDDVHDAYAQGRAARRADEKS